MGLILFRPWFLKLNTSRMVRSWKQRKATILLTFGQILYGEDNYFNKELAGNWVRVEIFMFGITTGSIHILFKSLVNRKQQFPDITVANLIDQSTRSWNVVALEDTVHPIDINRILKVQIPSEINDDCFTWMPNKKGKSSIKLTYYFTITDIQNDFRASPTLSIPHSTEIHMVKNSAS